MSAGLPFAGAVAGAVNENSLTPRFKTFSGTLNAKTPLVGFEDENFGGGSLLPFTASEASAVEV